MQYSDFYQNKVVLVTGGAKGVGRGISEAYLAAGATVVVCGRTAPQAGESLPQAGGRVAQFMACDIRQVESAQAMVDAIVAEHGRLDVLVNNAGGAPYALAADASPRFHEKIIGLNLLAPLTLAQMANRVMQAQGSDGNSGGVIVFIGSISALRPSPGTAAYGAAKAGVLSLVSTLAVEWAPKVRLVAISPSAVLTEQAHLHFGDAAGIAAISKTVPLGRMAEPADIGNACVYVSSPQAAYVSGINITLHGGGERPAFLDAANAQHGA